MGREIRRVPPNWQHPKTTNPYTGEEEYQPLYDTDYETKMADWIENHQLWMRGEHPDQLDGSGSEYKYFAQWDGNPPDVEYHHPKWEGGEATWYQLYETVSEGTPVSPPFATEEELIDYLVKHGDFWDQARGSGPYSRKAAEAIVNGGWAPSFVLNTTTGQMLSGAEALAEMNSDE